MAMIIPVILSGGSGSRLWPLSRQLYPKQLLALTGENTLIQQTANRIRGMEEAAPPIVICNHEHRFLVAEQIQATGIEPGAIILEPVGRNTAPAVAVAAFHALEKGENPLLLVLPADHVIKRLDVFQDAVQAGTDHASRGSMITFGIVPTGPETGYGYIKFEPGQERIIKGFKFYRALGFTEKPSLEKARRFLQEGNYYWNSGIFVWDAKIFLQRLAEFSKKFYNIYEEMGRKNLEEVYRKVEALPIDKAFMEKLPSFLVARAEFRWSDLGSWHSLWEVLEKDPQGNVAKGDVVLHEASGNLVLTTKKTVVIGARDLAIVETPHGLLVMRKDASPHLKKIIEKGGEGK